jgi:hypothetical protein
MPVRFSDDDLRDAMNHLARAFAKASDGKVLKREVSKKLRGILKPLVDERRARVLGLPGKPHSGEGMRQAIARQVRGATRWKGKNTGVSIIQRGRGMPRGFRFAGRAFNRETGWNPTTLGGEAVHQQVRPADWFDGAVTHDKPVVRASIVMALEGVADKLGDDIRRTR